MMLDFVSAINAFAGKKILLIGDVMLDRYVYGEAERLSPEAPVPVVKIERESSSIGGAGTVLRNLCALGADVTFISVIGTDHVGTEVTRLIGDLPNVTPYLIMEADRPTSLKTRFVAGHHQIARADYEINKPLSDLNHRKILSIIFDAHEKYDIMILSDYDKGLLRNLAAALIARAKSMGLPVIVDPKDRNYGAYKGATIVTPNLPELTNAYAYDSF